MADGAAQVPAKYQAYPCEEYFAKYAAEGFRHPTEQYMFVEAAENLEELVDEEEGKPLDFLSIGGPGVDGIRWGYRKGETGIWMWNPIEGELSRLAESIEDLLTGWDEGRIHV